MMGKRMLRKRRNRGLTLIEIMVVLIIIGLLAGLVAYNIGGVTASGYRTRIKSDLATIANACEVYKLNNNNKYPDNAEALAAGDNPILTKIPKDPWGNPYQLKREGSKVVVWCYGEDGVPGGTEGNDMDYSSADEDE